MKTKAQGEAVSNFAQLVTAGVEEDGLLSQIENAAEDAKRVVGQAMVDKRLSDLEPEDGKPKRCPRCGALARVRKKAVRRTFKSLSGTHTIKRNQHHCEGCSESFYPVDERLGLPKAGDASVELERRLADFAVNDVYEQAEARWNLHYPYLKRSSNQFRQTAKRLGRLVEEANPELLQSALLPPTQQSAATVYFMSDGGMVLLRAEPGKLAEMLGAGWREMKLGMVFRHENHLLGQAEHRGVISQARYAGDFSQEKFKEQLKAALNIECAGGAGQVVYLADGAPENWLLALELCPSAILILDWYHAVENIMKCGRALFGDENERCLAFWKAGAECLLAAGKIDLLVNTLMEAVDADATADELGALDDLIRYIRSNEKRMDYAKFRAMGLMIGSGPIESGQRHVIQVRMKRSGQRWGERGARQMARMRCAYRTAGPERFLKSIRWAHRETRRGADQLERLAERRRTPQRHASNR